MSDGGTAAAPQIKKPLAILYSRTSQDSEEAGEKVSIEQQIKDCQMLCERHGYEVFAIISDRNRSGRTYPTGAPLIDQDPIFQAYYEQHIGQPSRKSRDGLAEAFRHLDRINYIVVREETRLMRPLLNSYLETYIWQTLAHYNVSIHSCSEGIIRASNHEDQMLSRLKATTKDKDVSSRLRDSRVSLHAKRDAGALYQSPIFFGFKSNGHQRVRALKSELTLVRRIYTEYLTGKSIMGICRLLNDANIPNRSKHGVWQYKPIRRILERPFYAGYQFNTRNELIQSRPFKPFAVVTREEFQEAQRLLTKWETVPATRHYLHIISGLVKCGVCGKSLYPFQSRSGWGSDQKSTIRYYYCKYGKDLKTTAPECKAVLIREQYPPHSVKPGACRNGNGLVEFIFPLLLPTLIRQLIEPENKGRLTEQAEQKQRDLDEINGIERKLLDKNLVGIITEEQFNNLMAEYRVKRDKLTRELKALNDKLGGMIDTQLPIETLLNPELYKLPAHRIRELAHLSIESLWVWPQKVRVVMKDGAKFDVNRCKISNSRVLPHWRARIRGSEVGKDTGIDVVYFYKSCRQYLKYGKLPVKILYSTPKLRVLTLGLNDIYQKSELKRPFSFKESKATERSQIEVGGCEIQLELG